MGRTLYLLPFDRVHDAGWSHTLLPARSLGDLADRIEAVSSLPIPAEFYSHLGDGVVDGDDARAYGRTTHDAYGEPLRYTHAQELTALADHPVIIANWPLRAVWAYLGHLPPHTEVALYWD